jgi:hypothetical protein
MSPRRASAVVLIAAVALALGGCGSSHSHAGSGGPANTVPSSTAQLRVSPARPTTTDPITFAFTAPQASGVHGKSQISYSVSITGPSGNGCAGAKEATVPQVGKGGTASVTVGPSDLGSPWCAGSYSARAFELQSAACKGTAPCPQYIRVVGIVARATFTVASS